MNLREIEKRLQELVETLDTTLIEARDVLAAVRVTRLKEENGNGNDDDG